jgi:hypothetical protein
MLLEVPDVLCVQSLAALNQDPISSQSISSSAITEEEATLYLGNVVVGEFKSLLTKSSDEAKIIPIDLLCGYLSAALYQDLEANLLTTARFRVVTKSLILNDYQIIWTHTSDQAGERVVCNSLEGLWHTC